MVDTLGWRMKFGVIAPSTNTSVQPEFDDMRPTGVTNHFSRIHIPDSDASTDEGFLKMMDDIRGGTMEAIDSVMTCDPGYIVMGMSAETFWEGMGGAEVLKKSVQDRAGRDVALGSHAVQSALETLGDGKIRNIAIMTPYQPSGDEQVIRFFTDIGYNVVRLTGLKSPSPMLIAHEPAAKLRRTFRELDGPDVDALIQVGTNLACAKVAAEAEEWLEKPVIAINTATYWYALRQNGIHDQMPGFGALLEKH